MNLMMIITISFKRPNITHTTLDLILKNFHRLLGILSNNPHACWIKKKKEQFKKGEEIAIYFNHLFSILKSEI